MPPKLSSLCARVRSPPHPDLSAVYRPPRSRFARLLVSWDDARRLAHGCGRTVVACWHRSLGWQVVREALADVPLERLERVRISDHGPAEALAAETAHIRVGEDGGQVTAGPVLAHHIGAQTSFTKRTSTEEEIRIPTKRTRRGDARRRLAP